MVRKPGQNEGPKRVAAIDCRESDGFVWVWAAGTALGATLAFRFRDAAARQGGVGIDHQYLAMFWFLMDTIHGFRQTVEEKLPGMYVFFNDESLHITLRALMG